MRMKVQARAGLISAVAALCMALAPAALAAKRGSGGSTSSSITGPVLISDANGNGLPNWGDSVTFNVSTTATTQPFVRLNCYQNGTWAYTSTVGYYPSYPWDQYFTLMSGDWTSGAADCTATLYSVNNKTLKETDLATLSFHVYA